MKIAHIADTHIRNLKYHKEYKEAFSHLYGRLAEEKVDYIVHCGDIAHTKTQISPEFVDLCASFFQNLADIAPTYIILGNHDGNLKNSSRQDALSPIVDALAHPELHLAKDSGEILLDDGLVLNVLSVFDRDNWVAPSDKEAINIALYHGSISNCKTDLGWMMESGEDTLDIFKDFDFAMLGDIHKRQSLDADNRVWYCGSTIQQNHGETNDKGLLLWEIESKDDFTVRHIELKNPKPFLTIELTPKGKIPRKAVIQEGARLRLVSNNNLPLDVIRKAADVAKRKFKPESVTFLNRAAGNRGSVEDLTNQMFKEDLRDPAVQEELIQEYLKDYQADDEVMEKVYDLNRKFNTVLEKDEEVGRNVNWKILSLEWDNLFNYGEGNRVEFGTEGTAGVLGVFGKNFSGKSSIIDSFLYTLFNGTSKNSRKNLNVINQNKDSCRGLVEILVDGKVYSVERTSEKYVKRLKGEETLEAKTDVDFKYVNEAGDVISKNGLSRNDTDKNIRKVFGTLEDFLMTSMTSQHGALSFLGEGSTRRKEILAKFLDLEQFERKFRMAKEEATDLRGAVKRLEDRDFEEELTLAQTDLRENEEITEKKKKECSGLQLQTEILKGENDALDIKLRSAPSEMIDILEVTDSLRERRESYNILELENKNLQKECATHRELYDKIIKFVGTFDIELYRAKNDEVDSLGTQISSISAEIKNTETNHATHLKKVGLLSEVPCGEEYSHCKFIKDAYVSKQEVPGILRVLENHHTQLLRLSDSLKAFNTVEISTRINKYEQVLKKKNETANQIAQCELQTEKNQNQMILLQNEIKESESKQKIYNENKEVIENYSELKREKSANIKKIEKASKKVQICDEQLQQLYITHGAFVERADNIEKQQEELRTMREEYEAYDLYMRTMHPNGISYDVIKRRLPVINTEVAKVLANVVDFEVFFEEEGSRLNILIKHPKHEARPIEMGSGAEKSIAAMAIRLALLNVSTLPKPNLFILDEPGTALDEENMEGFTRILDLVKSQFSTVLLISHLDSLKDCVNNQIIIEKQNDFAYVRI